MFDLAHWHVANSEVSGAYDLGKVQRHVFLRRVLFGLIEGELSI